MEFAQQLLLTLSGPLGYICFFFIVFSCSWGVPLNSDLQMVTASVLASMGVFQLGWVMVIAFFALLAGDSVTFFLGRKVGPKILKKRPFRWIIKEQHLDRAQASFHRHGPKFLFFIRFIPLVRPALFFTAGTMQLPPRLFYFYNAISSIIYILVVMSCAFHFASYFAQQFHILQ
jgi:membrane-associated protein